MRATAPPRRPFRRRAEELQDRIDRPLAHPRAADFHPAHAALGGERNEVAAQFGEVTAANAVFLLGQHHDRTALRGFVGERRQLRRVRQFLLSHAGDRLELRRLPVAERDSAGLVEKERVDVAGGLDGRPDIASTLKRTSRSMPAMPIAESSAPIVVGMRVTNNATRMMTEIAPPAYAT